MPQGDRTGPNGMGSRTGRALGYCAGYDSPGFTEGMHMCRGHGFGRGRGFGHGFGRGFGRSMSKSDYIQEPTPVSKEQEKQMLEEELQELKQRIKEIESNLK